MGDILPQAGFLQNDMLSQALIGRALQGGLGADLSTSFTAPGPVSQLGQNMFVQLASGGHIGAALSMPRWDMIGQAFPLPGQLTFELGGFQFPTTDSNAWDPRMAGVLNPWLG